MLAYVSFVPSFSFFRLISVYNHIPLPLIPALPHILSQHRDPRKQRLPHRVELTQSKAGLLTYRQKTTK